MRLAPHLYSLLFTSLLQVFVAQSSNPIGPRIGDTAEQELDFLQESKWPCQSHMFFYFLILIRVSTFQPSCDTNPGVFPGDGGVDLHQRLPAAVATGLPPAFPGRQLEAATQQSREGGRAAQRPGNMVGRLQFLFFHFPKGLLLC